MKLHWLFTCSIAALLAVSLAFAQDVEEKEPAKEKPAEKKEKEDEKDQEKPKDDGEKKPAEKKPAEEKPAEKKPAEKEPAEENGEKRIKIESTEEVLSGLYNPCGVAIQPETGTVFVADSGSLRVVRVNSEGGAEDVITDFPKDVYGKGPMYDIGPLGLGFIDKDTLIVGGGGFPDGQELLRVYTLPEASKSIKAEDMKASLGPIEAGEASQMGEGNFYGIAISSTAIYVSSNGDDTKGWVLKADVADGTAKDLVPYIATKEATNVDAPVGITLHPDPKKGYIVVGQMGEINKPLDSLLTFYSAKDGKMLLNLETGLFDIAALAYSPRGRLYALDFAWMDASKGGLFRLDATFDDEGNQGVTAVHVMDLDKPTAMAFAPDGTLYVTVIGTAEEGSDEKPGKLLKIKGDL